LLGITDPGSAISTFDGLTEEEVENSRSWLSADPGYRAAVARLGLD
jgi:hypothetical protein